jgi:hypothetical protein
MASPAMQVSLDPPDKFYSTVFEGSSSARAVLADQYDSFVTLHPLMARCTLITPSPYWPAIWPPISRGKPCFANRNEIALRNSYEILRITNWPMCLPLHTTADCCHICCMFPLLNVLHLPNNKLLD